MSSELSLSEWAKTAQPGDTYIYATVVHLTDTYASRKIGQQAWSLAIEGTVYLVQRRVPYAIPSMFDYIAIKASKPPVRRIVAQDYGDPIDLGIRRRPVHDKFVYNREVEVAVEQV